MGFDHAGRVERLQALMTEHDVDATLLSVGADLPYFIGYEAMASERLTVLVVPASGEPSLLIPVLEAPRVTQGDFEMMAWAETDDPVALASTLVSPQRVAVGDHMWSVFLTRFQRQWPHSDWLPASELTAQLRLCKDEAEVDLLRKAARGVDRVMRRAPTEVAFLGRTEAEVARDLRAMTVEEGHESSESAIVGSGPNGASPHHHAGERIIQEGDVVVCDFGGRWGGYFSDSTRTFVVGEPSAEQLEVHEVVLAANEAGRSIVAPGVQCQEIDRAARSVIEEAGLGDHFIHRTGHGIGLEVHEHPYMVEGNERRLEPGMAFSVEPGVYLPGRYGVRIEDIVVCGVGSLNESERGLVSVT